jgi:nucleoside-diphosphate-sugar epimerase
MRNRSAFALVQAIVNGRFVYVGARDAVSTYIHVEDVVGALLCMAHAASGTIVNVSSDCPWTGLVQRICERARCKEPQIRIPEGVAQVAARLFGVLPRFPLTSSRVESLARRGGYPCDAARRILGFAPSRPMPQGFDEITDAVIAQT